MHDHLCNILLENEIKTVSMAEKFLKKELELLLKNGTLELEEDMILSGFSLELRVQELFNQKGFNIKKGRRGKEDFVIIFTNDTSIKTNIVIEVKSARQQQLKLDNLRQLDDWVFDLSGEEKARKDGLGGGFDITACATDGRMSTRHKHPTPYKGILVFNGPVGTSFSDRPMSMLHDNQVKFVEKRNFCIISIDDLKVLLEQDKDQVWEILHKTSGEYKKA
jgi:hypothetical protein